MTSLSNIFNLGSVKNKKNSDSVCESLRQGENYLRLQNKKNASIVEGFGGQEDNQENSAAETIDATIKDDIENTKKEINEVKEKYNSSKENYEAMVKAQITYIDDMKDYSIKVVTFPTCNKASVNPDTIKYGAYPELDKIDKFNNTSYSNNNIGKQKKCKALSKTYGVSMFGEVEAGVVDYNTCFNSDGKTEDEIKNYIENKYSNTWKTTGFTDIEFTDDDKNILLSEAARQLIESERQLLTQVKGIWQTNSCSELLDTTLYTNKGKLINDPIEKDAAAVTTGIADAVGKMDILGKLGEAENSLPLETFENPQGIYANGASPVLEPGQGDGKIQDDGDNIDVTPNAVVGKCKYSKKYIIDSLVTKKGISYCQQYAYINRFGFLQPFMVAKDKTKFNEEHARKLGKYLENGAGSAFNKIKNNILKDGTSDVDYTNIESSDDIESNTDKKFVLGAPIMLSEVPTEAVPFDLAGTMIIVEDNEELKAWIDYKGYKHEFKPDGVLPKSCPKEYRKVTDEQFNNLTQGEDIVDGEICNFLDTMGGSTMIAAKSQMEIDRDAYFNKLEELNERIKSVWGEANLTSTDALSMETSIQSEMNQLGVDNDTLNNLVEIRDTIGGQEETSRLTMGSNRMQLVLWSIIGISVLLYTMFGIGTDDSFKGKHLVMLIICAIIFFVLARTMYNNRKALNDY